MRLPVLRLMSSYLIALSGTALCFSLADAAPIASAHKSKGVEKKSSSRGRGEEKIKETGVTGMSALPEVLTVHAGLQTSNGVTNTTAGGGLMPIERAPRSQSGVTRDYIAKQTPTTSIVNLMASLPGVVAAKTDPLGMSPGDTMTMRGLTQAQIGFLFEGAPEADPINYGVSTSTIVDSENLGSMTVSQGSPDLDAPLINAAGGQIAAFEINPSHKMGGFTDFMGGTHSANKQFIRFNTGDIGNSGIRGFMSFSHTASNNSRGPGNQHRYHVDSTRISHT